MCEHPTKINAIISSGRSTSCLFTWCHARGCKSHMPKPRLRLQGLPSSKPTAEESHAAHIDIK